jgi:hypothetical protein
LAPTLPPLPPPNAKSSASVAGEVEVSGNVLEENAGAMVLALNDRTGEMGGQLLERDETHFSFRMRAEVDDSLTVFYLAHNEQSEAVSITVPAAEAAATVDDAPAPETPSDASAP